MEQKSGGTKLSREGKTERQEGSKGSDSISLPSAIASLIAENIGPPFGVRPVGTVPLASAGTARSSLTVPRPSVGPLPGHSHEEIYEGLNSAGRSEERRGFPEKITPSQRRDAMSVRWHRAHATTSRPRISKCSVEEHSRAAFI